MIGSNDKKQPSKIYIEFEEPGSVLFRTAFEGVTPMQLLAIAGYLELRARSEIIKEENARVEHEERMKLTTPPKPEIFVGKK
jgi:hypothetical protein